MWPFKNKIPFVKDVIFENDGDTITIFHEDGVHKFNKEEVLDSYITIDEFSAPKLKWFPNNNDEFSINAIIHAIYALSLFGGWWSMIYSLFPRVAIWIPDNSCVETSLYTENNDFLLYAVFWLILPLILTLISLYLTAILIRFFAVRYDDEYKSKYCNIVVFCLNHETIKVRFNQEKFDYWKNYKRPEDWISILISLNYLKNHRRVAETFIDLSDNARIIIAQIFWLLAVILLFFNWDKPFLFWQILEHTKLSEISWFKSFVLEHKETFQYYKYYAQYDLYKGLQYNANPIMAFLDGMLGTIIMPIFLIIEIVFILGWTGIFSYVFLVNSLKRFVIKLKINKILIKIIEFLGLKRENLQYVPFIIIALVSNLLIIRLGGYYRVTYLLIGASLFPLLIVWEIFGNIYKYFKGEENQQYEPQNKIVIRNQFWMSSDLKVSKFQNGDSIFQAKTQEEWKQAFVEQKPAWCYYNFKDDIPYDFIPKLYNLYAISDPRGLAPEGFKIPSKEDWKTLWNAASIFSYCESEGVRPELIRELKSKSGWNPWQINKIVCDYHSHNEKYSDTDCDNCQSNGKLINEFYSGDGNNELGFGAYPYGIISDNGESLHKGECVNYWTLLDDKNANDLGFISIDNKNTPIKLEKVTNRSYGFSVRCIKEE
jgi:uncharacterized protein (TIGR02145 family)